MNERQTMNRWNWNLTEQYRLNADKGDNTIIFGSIWKWKRSKKKKQKKYRVLHYAFSISHSVRHDTNDRICGAYSLWSNLVMFVVSHIFRLCVCVCVFVSISVSIELKFSHDTYGNEMVFAYATTWIWMVCVCVCLSVYSHYATLLYNLRHCRARQCKFSLKTFRFWHSFNRIDHFQNAANAITMNKPTKAFLTSLCIYGCFLLVFFASFSVITTATILIE